MPISSPGDKHRALVIRKYILYNESGKGLRHSAGHCSNTIGQTLIFKSFQVKNVQTWIWQRNAFKRVSRDRTRSRKRQEAVIATDPLVTKVTCIAIDIFNNLVNFITSPKQWADKQVDCESNKWSN